MGILPSARDLYLLEISFQSAKNKTMYVIAESGDTGLLLYKNIGKGKSLSMEDFPVLMFRED